MSDLTIGRESAGAAARSASDVYRAVWRWHFYAGLMVLPFMITLAITGALYLFKDEIDAAVYSDFKQVELQENVGRTAPSVMVAAAVAAHPGTAVKFTDPPSPTSSAEITVSTESEGKLAVYVSPYTDEVLGALPDRGTIVWTIRYLNRRRLVDPSRGNRHLSLVAAQADGWGAQCSWHSEATRLLARYPCGDGPLRRLLHRLPGDHRHALVRRLG
jgi:uncharacterized iron-regulated membrane protein